MFEILIEIFIFIHMSEKFDIKVQIRGSLRKKLIFGLNSRLSIGIILGFVGLRNDVWPIMQAISHATRAYLVNEKGLLGFLMTDVINIL